MCIRDSLDVVRELERGSVDDPDVEWVSVFLAAIPQTPEQATS